VRRNEVDKLLQVAGGKQVQIDYERPLPERLYVYANTLPIREKLTIAFDLPPKNSAKENWSSPVI
jgi:hypothetical protein